MSNDGHDPQDQQDDSLTGGESLGGEPASAAQKSYISRMAADVGEEVPFELTKAEAEDKIRELEIKTGRDSTPELAS